MKTSKVLPFIREYTTEYGLPEISFLPSFLLKASELGIIPTNKEYYYNSEALRADSDILSDTEGDVLEEYFLGPRDYYVREGIRSVSYYNEDTEIGFIIYIPACLRKKSNLF